MPEQHLFEAAVAEQREQSARTLVREVPAVPEDAAFQRVGIGACLEHTHIVVALKQQRIEIP